MGDEKNRNYEVKSGSEKHGDLNWIRVSDAKEVDQGFLHYELKDGTNGLARPGTWRFSQTARANIVTGPNWKRNSWDALGQ